MGYHNTRTVARILGITANTIVAAIARDKFAPPQRDEGGRYCWTNADIERARVAMKIDRRFKQQEGAA